MARPHSPAHLNAHGCNTGGKSPPELFAFPIQDVHHATRPAILHSLHSVHMSRMKSLIGCKVVVRIEECMTVITQA